MSNICEKCGHPIEGHGEYGCDWELRDYGDMDCGCTAHPRHTYVDEKAAVYDRVYDALTATDSPIVHLRVGAA